MASDRTDIIERLEAIASEAATDPLTPGIIATVYAPKLGIDWSVARPGPLSEGRSPSSVEQPFRIASSTKLYVATAIMRLIETDALRMEDVLGTLVSNESLMTLRAAGYEPDRISVFHLLSHTSGLRDHIAQESYVEAVVKEPLRHWSRLEQVEVMAAAGAPLATPGAHYEYSDTGYILLGEVIERATQEALGPAVRRLARFERADQRATWWELDEAPISAEPLAKQFVQTQDFTAAAPYFDLYGGGGLISTVGDLARFARALMRGELFDSPGLLSSMLVVPPAERATGARIHAAGPMVIAMGEGYGWGHSGFWGCITAHSCTRDVTVALTLNQPTPQKATLLSDVAAALGGAVQRR